jgi:hypothetical protein
MALDALVAETGSRGVEPDSASPTRTGVRRVIHRDADGNEIGYGGQPA